MRSPPTYTHTSCAHSYPLPHNSAASVCASGASLCLKQTSANGGGWALWDAFCDACAPWTSAKSWRATSSRTRRALAASTAASLCGSAGRPWPDRPTGFFCRPPWAVSGLCIKGCQSGWVSCRPAAPDWLGAACCLTSGACPPVRLSPPAPTCVQWASQGSPL